MNGYCVDTSAIVDLHKVYPPRIFGTLWTKIDALVVDAKFRFCEEVLNELQQVDDEPFKWAKSIAPWARIPLDPAIQSRVSAVMAAHPNLVRLKKGKWTSQADPFVIAGAMEHNLIVVTSEKFSRDMTNPRIPDCCKAGGVQCVNILGMFDDLGWQV